MSRFWRRKLSAEPVPTLRWEDVAQDGTRLKLEVITDMIAVPTVSGYHLEPDPEWSFTDAAGHEHHWSLPARLVTLTTTQELRYWCPDCQDQHIDPFLVCALCHERIQPGYEPVQDQPFIPGMKHYLINDEEVSQELFMAIIAEMKR